MKSVSYFPYTITGDRADEAADFIYERERHLDTILIASFHPVDDHADGMRRILKEAIEKFGVEIA